MASRFASRARPDRSTEGHNVTEPEEGHPGQAVPEFPDPLPGTHHYRQPEPAGPHDRLDVGPAKPYYEGGMAHGVHRPPQHGGRPAPVQADRAAAEASAADRDAARRLLPASHDAVAVYVVDAPGDGNRPLKRIAPRGKVQVSAPGGEPVLIAGKDPRRTSIKLLCESASGGNNVRFHSEYGVVANGGGSLLPAGATSYLELVTQDEVWALTDPAGSGASFISVISQYNVAKGT